MSVNFFELGAFILNIGKLKKDNKLIKGKNELTQYTQPHAAGDHSESPTFSKTK
jgi:hypothetical protein